MGEEAEDEGLKPSARAKAQFARAAGLDLTAADKAELARVSARG